MSEERETMLACEGVELAYGRKTILAGVDLAVRAGEAWFLLGSNGSGKTTLLRAILGLLAPKRGRLVRHPELGARERLGFVPQVTDINPSLPTTVREFVSLGLAGAGVPAGEHARCIARALERVAITHLEQADYWSLSGGQRQRALIARALVRRPSWMVLDEPTEGLDVATEESLLDTLGALNREDGVTLFFVTHKLSVAARHATHVALFHDGGVLSGPRDEVLRSPPARRIFGAELGAVA